MGLRKGLTVNLLKDLLQKSIDVNNQTRKESPHILWSAYDRIDVKETNSFQEYFENSFYPNEWIGDIQSLYLYPFCEDDDHPLLHVSEEDEAKGLFYFDDLQSPYLFFSIVTLEINDVFSLNFNHETYLVQEVINRLRRVAANDIRVEAFRSMGTDDIVLLFLANRISDIVKSVYLLRSIKIDTKKQDPIFFCSTTYSVMGQNCIDPNMLSGFKDSEARAQVLLTLRENERAEDFRNSLPDDFKSLVDDKKVAQDEFIEMRIGEYDIQISASAKEVFLKQYLNGNILTAESDEYKKFIQNSKTIWFLNNDSLPTILSKDYIIEFTEENVFSTNQIENVNDIIFPLKLTIKELKNKIETEREKNLTDKKANDNLIAVYQDIILFMNELIKITCSCSHSEWILYIKRIAGAFNTGIKYYLKMLVRDKSIAELKKENFEENIHELNVILSDLRNALSHIHKSGEHFYNVPHPSIYYSGSAHKVLMAYYNFIDFVLSLGYLKPHANNTKQSNISFFITFGMTNKVKTNIHFKSTNTTKNRLVSFQLPYAALYDFKKYFPAILHEVYHLIAPTDRRYRNRLLLDFWLNKLLREYIRFYINSFFDESTLFLDSEMLVRVFFYDQANNIIRYRSAENQ